MKVHSFGGEKAPAKPAAVSAPAVAASASPVSERRSSRPAGWVDVPKLSGCYSVGARCECIDEEGRPVRIAQSMCEVSSRSYDGLVQWEKRKPVDESALPKAPPPPGAAFMAEASAKPH
jgi:hypothetical protein